MIPYTLTHLQIEQRHRRAKRIILIQISREVGFISHTHFAGPQTNWGTEYGVIFIYTCNWLCVLWRRTTYQYKDKGKHFMVTSISSVLHRYKSILAYDNATIHTDFYWVWFSAYFTSSRLKFACLKKYLKFFRFFYDRIFWKILYFIE